MEKSRLLNVQAVADELGVTVACIRRWIYQRRITTVKIGRLVKVPETEVQRVIQIGTRHACPVDHKHVGGGSRK